MAEAYLNLLGQGELRPTAREIAEAAGCSERAVFRHFQDMETLHSEAAAIQIQRVSRDVPGQVEAVGPVPERAAALAHRWAVLNEKVSPVRRVALLQEPFSTEIARRLRWVRDLALGEIEHVFAAELATLDAALRRRRVAAMSAAMSWESWNLHRRHLGLDPAEAEAAVAGALLSLTRELSLD